jgi:hypothetical protein
MADGGRRDQGRRWEEEEIVQTEKKSSDTGSAPTIERTHHPCGLRPFSSIPYFICFGPSIGFWTGIR